VLAAGQQAQHRRLAAAVGPDHAHAGALVDLEIEAAQDGSGTESLRYAGEADQDDEVSSLPRER